MLGNSAKHSYATVRSIKKKGVHLCGPGPGGPQVAYVVSWLNEAQMKPRCPPGSPDTSWDSIRTRPNRSPLAVPRSEACSSGRSPPPEPVTSPLVLCCPPAAAAADFSKRHARTLQGKERPGRLGQTARILR